VARADHGATAGAGDGALGGDGRLEERDGGEEESEPLHGTPRELLRDLRDLSRVRSGAGRPPGTGAKDARVFALAWFAEFACA